MFLRFFLLLFLLTGFARAQWLSPYFKQGPRDDVLFRSIGGVVSAISMDEEIPPPIVLAIVDGYSGSEKPTLASFVQGNNFDLGLDFQQNAEGEWEMITNIQQDYEQAGMQLYIFNVQIESTQNRVQISISNIFDNKPVLTSDSNPCSDVPELADPDFDTECHFNVFDIDGMAGNAITFDISGTSGENLLFEFKRLSGIDQYNDLYTLMVKQTLHYEQRAMYNFRVFVRDIALNEGVSNVIVEVMDLPNMPPIWVKAFASARFDEKTPKQFDVIAIDGDTGINTPICYKLEFEFDKDFSDLISIDLDSGIIDVKSIDRDEMKIEFYPFVIIAYKCNNESYFISGSAALIIDDINDNYPEIFFSEAKEVILIKEETFATLFRPDELYADDLDLGPNASYEIILTQTESAAEEYAKALNIVPNSGYQRQSFTISVADVSLIDFEEENWQEFDIVIQVTETDNKEHQSTKTFRVQLLNWNDELPIFDQEEFHFEVNETVAKDFSMGFVKAKDRDIDDNIEYFLTGRLSETFAIDITTGELSTLIDDAFDYERQTEVYIQVEARDTLVVFDEKTHTIFTQVRISVLDVNDETPQLTMPRGVLTVVENTVEGVITSDIVAVDPDTTANLKFSIDWDRSEASKPGFVVDRKFFVGCFIIEELEETRNKVFGVLSINSSFEYQIDYEEYELVSLIIVVEDLNQEVGEGKAEAVLVIRIEDVNDNAPEFIDNTLTVSRKVVEEAETGALVGSIMARDIDGPGNNDIQYFINPIEDTPEDWMAIDENGAIKVLENRAIGCDVPRRDDLKYEIRLFDGVHETLGIITISIDDINNKMPEIDRFDAEVEIYENATTGELITTVEVTDLDRDAPNNVVQFYINYRNNPDLQNFFAVEEMTGRVFVNLFGSNLDRDNGKETHSILINFEDNYGGNGVRNGNQTLVLLILKDVNDNAPEMPLKSVYEISENAELNTVIDESFEAPDKDDPNTPNAQVLYEILSIEPDTVDADEPKGYEDLFGISSYDNKYGRIYIKSLLQGFSGKWKIEIRAYDRGDEWDSRISLSSTEFYFINVNPFNFNSPQISYPRNDASIRLDFDEIAIGRTLTLINGATLPPFEAVDDDAGIFGDITFEVTSETNDHLNFEMFKLNRKQSELRVLRSIEERTYVLNIAAIDGGLANDRVTNIRISFVNKTGEPYFVPNTWTTDFTENVEGRDEIRVIPEAIDPKNVDATNAEDIFQIYYFIDESFKPDDSKFFQLNSISRELSLKMDLDREEVDNHQLRIISTNSESYPSRRPSEDSMLLISISVNDVNDNSPTFEYKNYAVGVSEQDSLGKILLTLHATDPDLDDIVTYYLLTDTINVTDANLNNVKDTAFILNPLSGALTLNFKLEANIKGYFEFTVQARDLVNHTDEAYVKIYLVAEANRVTFVFLNNFQVVRKTDQTALAAIFTAAYDAECVIDEIIATTTDGVAEEARTDMKVHFVKNNEALEAKEISEMSSDIIFISKLNTELIKLFLNLQGLPREAEVAAEESQFMLILLSVLCGVFGVLLVGFVVFHVIQSRNYKKEIKLLVDTSFTEPSTELNKTFRNLPNTNIFNEHNPKPILSTVDLDTKSIVSSDSDDFAGLDENPIFNISGHPESNVKNPLGTSVKDSENSSYI